MYEYVVDCNGKCGKIVEIKEFHVLKYRMSHFLLLSNENLNTILKCNNNCSSFTDTDN